MANLVDIATSGASMELCLELMAKHIEKRLTALETGDKATKTEEMLSSVMSALSKMKTNVTVNAAEIPAAVVNVEPKVTVMPAEDKTKTIKMTFERSLSGAIESATIVKG